MENIQKSVKSTSPTGGRIPGMLTQVFMPEPEGVYLDQVQRLSQDSRMESMWWKEYMSYMPMRVIGS